jgi:DNA-binding MarR family transcriptional regulator
VSAGELADILHVHPSTLTGVLQRLTRHRLLARVADPRDRRRAILRLTPSGQRANGSSQGTVEGSVARVLQSLPPADRAATRRVLVALAGSLAPATPPLIRSSRSSSRTSASRGSAGAVRASKGRRTRR